MWRVARRRVLTRSLRGCCFRPGRCVRAYTGVVRGCAKRVTNRLRSNFASTRSRRQVAFRTRTFVLGDGVCVLFAKQCRANHTRCLLVRDQVKAMTVRAVHARAMAPPKTHAHGVDDVVAAKNVSTVATTAPNPGPDANLHVLLVEDDHATLVFVKALLMSCGHQGTCLCWLKRGSGHGGRHSRGGHRRGVHAPSGGCVPDLWMTAIIRMSRVD